MFPDTSRPPPPPRGTRWSVVRSRDGGPSQVAVLGHQTDQKVRLLCRWPPVKTANKTAKMVVPRTGGPYRITSRVQEV